MCRLFGFIGTPDREAIKIIRGLIIVEEQRNPHGTGLAISNGRNFRLIKKGIKGLGFLVQGYADFLWNEDFKYLIGHVRYKTSGEQSDRNSHPFGSKAGENWYFLAHNGVLGEKMREIAKKFGANKLSDVKVDSELFLRAITAQIRQGVNFIDAIKNATYEVSDVGDFAFSLLCGDGIYLWRNSQRPLSIFYHKGNIFYASTILMFEEALKLAGVKTEKITYTELKPYQLYRITIPKGEKKPVVAIIGEMPHKERVIEKPKYSSYSYGYGSYYSDYYYRLLKEEEEREKKKKKNKKNKKEKEPRYNPLWGDTCGLEDESRISDELLSIGEIDPSELSDEELEGEIDMLEQYYYTLSDAEVEEKREVEKQLRRFRNELYNRLNAYYREGNDEVEPF